MDGNDKNEKVVDFNKKKRASKIRRDEKDKAVNKTVDILMDENIKDKKQKLLKCLPLLQKDKETLFEEKSELLYTLYTRFFVMLLFILIPFMPIYGSFSNVFANVIGAGIGTTMCVVGVIFFGSRLRDPFQDYLSVDSDYKCNNDVLNNVMRDLIIIDYDIPTSVKK